MTRWLRTTSPRSRPTNVRCGFRDQSPRIPSSLLERPGGGLTGMMGTDMPPFRIARALFSGCALACAGLVDWRAGRPELTVPVSGGGGRDRSDEELQRGQRPGPGEQSAAARMVQTPVSLAAAGDRAAADARGAAAGAGRLRDAGNHLERVSTGRPGKSTGIRAPIVHEIRYDHPPGRCCAPRIAGVHATRGGFRTERHVSVRSGRSRDKVAPPGTP